MNKNTNCIIVTTDNYDQFKFFESNRRVKKRVVKKLTESFRTTKGMLSSKPILVNKNLYVLDGQHRLEACREMGIPVHYTVVNDDVKEIPIYNTYQEKWDMTDFVEHYASKGNKNYKKLLEIKEKTGVSIPGIFEMVTSVRGGYGKEHIKKGTFTFDMDVEQAVKEVNEVMELCFVVLGKRIVKTKIIRAVRFLERIRAFEVSKLIEKIKKFQGKLYSCTSSEEYIDMFIKLYNYHRTGDKITERDLLVAKSI